MFKLRNPSFRLSYYEIPTYRELVCVVNGVCTVKYPETVQRLLSLGFQLIEDETPKEEASKELTDDEIKREALRLIKEEGLTLVSVARRLGISKSRLRELLDDSGTRR